MYVNVFFVIRCLYSAVSLTLVREQRFIRMIYYYVFQGSSWGSSSSSSFSCCSSCVRGSALPSSSSRRAASIYIVSLSVSLSCHWGGQRVLCLPVGLVFHFIDEGSRCNSPLVCQAFVSLRRAAFEGAVGAIVPLSFISLMRTVGAIVSLSFLSLIHIWRCRRAMLCRSRWSPYH